MTIKKQTEVIITNTKAIKKAVKELQKELEGDW